MYVTEHLSATLARFLPQTVFCVRTEVRCCLVEAMVPVNLPRGSWNTRMFGSPAWIRTTIRLKLRGICNLQISQRPRMPH
jgi:hypothetical protein